MSYSTESAKDNVERNMFVRLSPRIRVEDWTLHSGSVYKNATMFTSLNVVSLAEDGSSITAGTSASLSAGQYWFDTDTGTLYYRNAGSTAPASTDWIIATFEVYLSTKECLWYRTPTDNTSTLVQWRGLLTSTPTVTQSTMDSLFGFIPAQVNNLACVNEKEFFQSWIYDVSTLDAEFKIWHQAGSLSTGNFQAIFTGLMGDFDFNDTEITFSLFDKTRKMQEKIDNGAYADRMSSTFYERENTFIRSVYGTQLVTQRWLYAACYDATTSSPTTSNNRNWATMSAVGGTPYVDFTATTVHTTTYFTIPAASAKKLDEGDEFRAGSGTYLSLCNDVDWSSGDINFSLAPTVSGSNYRAVGHFRVKLLQNGVAYSLKYGRDFADTIVTADTYGIALTTTCEANVGASTINPANGDMIIAMVRGADIAPTFGGSAISTKGKAYANPIVILYHFLKDRMGFAESEIDGTTFQTLADTEQARIWFACPEVMGGDTPTWADVIAKICASAYLRLYLDVDGKWTIKKVDATTDPATFELTDADIYRPSYTTKFSDVGIARVIWHQKEISFTTSKTAVLEGTGGAYQNNNDSLQDFDDYTYGAASYLHSRSKEVEAQTYFFTSIDYTDTARDSGNTTPITMAAYGAKIAQLVGERKHYLTCDIKAGGWGIEIGDTIEIQRESQPGFSYSSGTLQSRFYIVVEVQKSLSAVRVILDDQKAVEDNAGDW